MNVYKQLRLFPRIIPWRNLLQRTFAKTLYPSFTIEQRIHSLSNFVTRSSRRCSSFVGRDVTEKLYWLRITSATMTVVIVRIWWMKDSRSNRRYRKSSKSVIIVKTWPSSISILSRVSFERAKGSRVRSLSTSTRSNDLDSFSNSIDLQIYVSIYR